MTEEITYKQISVNDRLPTHNNKVIIIFQDGGCDYMTTQEIKEHFEKDKYLGGGRLRNIDFWLEKFIKKH